MAYPGGPQPTVIVYRGTNHVVALTLYKRNFSTRELEIADLTSVTRMVLSFGTTDIDSDIQPSGFDWDDGYGLVKLYMGAFIPVGWNGPVKLTVYDPDNPLGIVWIPDAAPGGHFTMKAV